MSGLHNMLHVFALGMVAALASQEGAAVSGATSVETAEKVRSTEASSGLWVCDPTIRHLLETAPASVSRGEILGRCHETYTTAACEAAQNALFRGPSVIANLELLCGPLPPAAELVNAGTVGAGPYKVGYMEGVGFGPLGKGVKVPGANGEPHTSFRGPISPPLTNVVDLDKTTKGKVMPKKFSWEKPSRSNSSGIDSAADAVRVFDAAGLGGGSTMQGASRFPLSSSTRTTDAVENPMNATDVSMNVTPVLPVQDKVIPESEDVQAAGNDVAVAPYAYAPYEGDWGNSSYWDAEGPLPDSEFAAPSILRGERSKEPKLVDVQREDLEDDDEDTPLKEHHHKRHKKHADAKSSGDQSRRDNVLDSEQVEGKLLSRAGAAVAESESGKLLGMAASAQKR